MSINSAQDDRVLALRAEGRSFAAIAWLLSFDNAAAAYDAFQRAVRNAPGERRAGLQLGELERLDRLAEQLRHRSSNGDTSAEGRLHAIGRLRAREVAEWIDRVAELPTATIDPS